MRRLLLLLAPLATAAEPPAALWREVSPPDAPAVRTVLFEPCRATLDRGAIEIVRRNGLYLRDHPGLGVGILSLSDSRASRSYNLALAFQRAKAVADLLQLYDIPPERIVLLPYGEEGGREGRSLGRRVRLIYLERRE